MGIEEKLSRFGTKLRTFENTLKIKTIDKHFLTDCILQRNCRSDFLTANVYKKRTDVTIGEFVSYGIRRTYHEVHVCSSGLKYFKGVRFVL